MELFFEFLSAQQLMLPILLGEKVVPHQCTD